MNYFTSDKIKRNQKIIEENKKYNFEEYGNNYLGINELIQGDEGDNYVIFNLTFDGWKLSFFSKYGPIQITDTKLTLTINLINEKTTLNLWDLETIEDKYNWILLAELYVNITYGKPKTNNNNKMN